MLSPHIEFEYSSYTLNAAISQKQNPDDNSGINFIYFMLLITLLFV